MEYVNKVIEKQAILCDLNEGSCILSPNLPKVVFIMGN